LSRFNFDALRNVIKGTALTYQIFRFAPIGRCDLFKKLRRHDKKLSLEEGRDILERGVFGVLSTIGEDGYPYGTPLNYVFDDGHIYFHSACEGHKISNILFSNKVSFCVVDSVEVLPSSFSTNYKSVVAYGIASLVAEASEKLYVLKKIVEKFSPDFEKESEEVLKGSLNTTCIIRIDVQHITCKGNIEV